jgi:hypothetical protein
VCLRRIAINTGRNQWALLMRKVPHRHAKIACRKRRHLRGYASCPGLTKSGVAGQVARRPWAPLVILAPTEGLWRDAALVSVPLLLCGQGT